METSELPAFRLAQIRCKRITSQVSSFGFTAVPSRGRRITAARGSSPAGRLALCGWVRKVGRNLLVGRLFVSLT